MKRTITLYKYIENEIKKDRLYNDIEDDSNIMTKIFNYDKDISLIVNDLFNHIELETKKYDNHFKQYFLYRFLNREINQQTIGSFKMVLTSTFMSNFHFINRIYEDMENYVLGKHLTENKNQQSNIEKSDGSNTTDNRSAFADLPQSTVNLDVDDTNLDNPTDNTVSRNKENQQQNSKGYSQGKNTVESVDYDIDELFKTNGILENVLNIFDSKCFLQIW